MVLTMHPLTGVTVAASAAEAGPSWSTYQGNYEHNGSVQADLSYHAGVVAWKTWEEMSPASPPVVNSTGACFVRLYFDSGSAYWIYYIDGSRGIMGIPYNQNDYHPYYNAINVFPPAVLPDDSLIYGMAYAYSVKEADESFTHHTMYSLNSTSGWSMSFPAKEIVFSQPTVGPDGSVYLFAEGELDDSGVTSDVMLALDPDLTVRWMVTEESSRSVVNDGYMQAPTLAPDGSVLFATSHGIEQILSNGARGWTYSTTYVSAPVVGKDGELYISSMVQSNIIALGSDGAYRWSFQTGLYRTSVPTILNDGRVAFHSNDGNIYVLNASGEVNMTMAVGSPGEKAIPIVVDPNGIMVTASSLGTVTAVNPDGTIRWVCHTKDPVVQPLAVAPGGQIFAVTNRSVLELDMGTLYGIPFSVEPSGPTAYHLTWTLPDVDQQIRSFQIYREELPARLGPDAYRAEEHNWHLIANLSANVTEFYDRDVDQDHVYLYRLTFISPMNPSGNSYSTVLMVGDVDKSSGQPLSDILVIALPAAAILAGLACLVIVLHRRKGKYP